MIRIDDSLTLSEIIILMHYQYLKDREEYYSEESLEKWLEYHVRGKTKWH